MKVCELCGDEISTKDGENLCGKCDEANTRSKRDRARQRRRAKDEAMLSMGLVKVRGALGGIYWE